MFAFLELNLLVFMATSLPWLGGTRHVRELYLKSLNVNRPADRQPSKLPFAPRWDSHATFETGAMVALSRRAAVLGPVIWWLEP